MCGCSSATQRTYYSRQSIEMRARLITRVSRVSHDAAPKSRWHRRHAPPGAAQRLSGDDIPPVAGFSQRRGVAFAVNFVRRAVEAVRLGHRSRVATPAPTSSRVSRAPARVRAQAELPLPPVRRVTYVEPVARARPAGGMNVCAAERVCLDVFFFFVPSPEGARAAACTRLANIWHQFFARAKPSFLVGAQLTKTREQFTFRRRPHPN